jgi:uncharacterized protein (TIGR02147 family)
MTLDIYQYDSYKTYLEETLTAQGHGSKLRFAEALRCQPGYLSQVLKHEAHLSFEQAEDLAHYLKLNEDETEFLFLLLHRARAGTKQLQSRWSLKIKDIREKRAQLSNRVKSTTELDEMSKTTYYSRWYYGALHSLVTIPGKRTKTAMQSYLGLSDDQIRDGLVFLERNGIIKRDNDEYRSGPFALHLKSDSPQIVQLHSNWRLRAIERLKMGDKVNLNYTSIYTLSRDDFDRIKGKLLDSIEEIRGIVRKSPEEELCVLGIDFYFPGNK